MPNILSIETSSDACSVSLVNGPTVVSQEADEPRSHARMLVPIIQELLARESTPLDAVCVDAGPGSYTGLRIGVSTAKGLSWSLGIPLFAPSSLSLMAAGASMQLKLQEGIRIRSVMAARGDEVYTAVYATTGSGLSRIETPRVCNMAELAPSMDDDRLIASTDALADRLKGLDVQVIAPHSSHAAHLLMNPGWECRVESVSSFEPLYLREFEAKKPAVSIFDRLPF